MSALLHLSIVGQDPVSEGPRGCDYAWSLGFVAYRCLPHRWVPGADWSYGAFQAQDLTEDLETAAYTAAPLAPSQLATPEADLYGDNALDIEV